MFVLLLVVTCILESVHSLPMEEILVRLQWEDFKVAHNKSYKTLEEAEYRLGVFINNLDVIFKHNQLYHKGLSTYRMGVNQFADITDEEFENQYLVPHKTDSVDDSRYPDLYPNYQNNVASFPLPASVDWRLTGAVTEVKNQGNCSAGYAFSAVGALESHYYLAHKYLVSLSAQNILDCSGQCFSHWYYNEGCSGGQTSTTFRYIINNGGIDTEKSYPYKGYVKRCTFKGRNVGADMYRYKRIQQGNETDLQVAVARIGPVSVTVDVKGLKQYMGGLYDNRKCHSKNPKHAMLVVGYGTSKPNMDHWIVKNSFGKQWGEQGYIFMRRNGGNQCGIASEALYPLV